MTYEQYLQKKIADTTLSIVNFRVLACLELGGWWSPQQIAICCNLVGGDVIQAIYYLLASGFLKSEAGALYTLDIEVAG